MAEPLQFLDALLLSLGAIGKLFLVALVGFLFVRRRIITDEMIQGLARLMIDAIVPCALSVAMIKGLNRDTLTDASPAILLPALYVPLSALVVLGFFRLSRGGNSTNSDRACAAVASIPNSIYVPLPLAMAVTPPEHQLLVGVYVGAAVLAINPLQWTLGSWLVMGERSHESRDWRNSLRQTLNGPVIGIIAGVILAFVPGFPEAARGEAGSFFPLQVLFGAMAFLGQAMAPMAMVVIGALIGQCRAREVMSLRRLAPILLSRFLIVPGLVWLSIVSGLVPATGLVAFVLMLTAAAPPAMNMALVARRYDGEWEIVSAMLLISNVVAVVVLPLWMSVGLSL